MSEDSQLQAYKIVAERKDHSDTLYYAILNACILVNSGLGAGAATVLRSMKSGLDLAIVLLVSAGGLVLTFGFNRYLQNEKHYQDGLEDGLKKEEIPKELPDIFNREKSAAPTMIPTGWSLFPFWFAIFWGVLMAIALVRYLGWIYHC